MNFCHCTGYFDYGPEPYVINTEQIALQNANFRTAIWTGNHLQMTLMCIPPCGEIGTEIHESTDQLILIEAGMAVVKIGKCRNQMDFQRKLSKGDAVFIPAGNWHNIINAGRNPLKLCSVYAPPNHPRGTIHKTKADALLEE
jgi:mannose-6-phosphate isomerase-like protein (cupin superfamily)